MCGPRERERAELQESSTQQARAPPDPPPPNADTEAERSSPPHLHGKWACQGDRPRRGPLKQSPRELMRAAGRRERAEQGGLRCLPQKTVLCRHWPAEHHDPGRAM